jgi:hypothetical protein
MLGHELVHSLHIASASFKLYDSMTEAAIWDDMEEHRTILQGKLSEQTLRAQYGLTVERFGHGETPPNEAVADAYKRNLAVLQRMRDLGPEELEATLRTQGFESLVPLSITTKLAIVDAKPAISGTVPEGWDANSLSIDQLRVVMSQPELSATELKRLGWSPFELDRGGADTALTLQQVLAAKRAHPRSTDGLRYRALGGDATLETLAVLKFPGVTGVSTDWPLNLAAVKAADRALQDSSPDWAELVKELGRAPTKLKDVTRLWAQANNKQVDAI